MTTSNIENATDSAIKSAHDIKIESAAVKSELPTAEAVTKMEEVKIKAPVKVNKKAVAKKAAAAPIQVQAPASSTKKLPIKATSTLIAKAPSKLLAKAPATTSAKVLEKLPSKAKAQTHAQQAAKPSVKVLAEKASKQKKPKLVRDSFTIPKAEYSVLDDLKQRAVRTGTPTKKSELLRAGIKALAAMTDAGFKAALSAVPTIKTGRPAKD